MRPQRRRPSFQADCSRIRIRLSHLHELPESLPVRVSATELHVSIRESELPLKARR